MWANMSSQALSVRKLKPCPNLMAGRRSGSAIASVYSVTRLPCLAWKYACLCHTPTAFSGLKHSSDVFHDFCSGSLSTGEINQLAVLSSKIGTAEVLHFNLWIDFQRSCFNVSIVKLCSSADGHDTLWGEVSRATHLFSQDCASNLIPPSSCKSVQTVTRLAPLMNHKYACHSCLHILDIIKNDV